MPTSVPIPQDVIEGIIDHLHEDKASLKCCAAVSRCFRVESRLHLFSAIRLDSPLTTQQLFTLISQTPDIATLIRELFIDPDPNRCSTSWVAENVFLPTILKMLHRLKALSLRNPTILRWDLLSPEIQSALVDQFRSPTLDVVKFFQVHNLPISLITSFTHLKVLSLHFVGFHNGSGSNSSLISTLAFTRLEMLDLRLFGVTSVPRGYMPVAFFAQMQAVQLLSLWSCTQETLSLARAVIRSSSHSIKCVMWNVFRFPREIPPPKLPLGLIDNLQCLFFTMFLRWNYEYEFNADLLSLVQYFGDDSVTENLEELTIAFNVMSGYPTWDSALMAITNCTAWTDVDTALCTTTSVLRRVHVFVKPPRDVVNDEQLQRRLPLILPGLHERGVLSTGMGTFDELRAKTWSRRGY